MADRVFARFWCRLVGSHVFEFIEDEHGRIVSEPICVRCGYQNRVMPP